MKLEILERLNALRADKQPCALVTDLKTGLQAIVHEGGTHGAFAPFPEDRETVLRRIAEDRSGIVEEGDQRLFVQVFAPPLRLLLVGAVHIAQALVPMAVLAGYAVTIVDPRRAFGNAERFPGVALSDLWPDEGIAALAPDRRTAVVTLTHDPKLDDPALLVALRSPAFYVGSLGSRKTHAKRVARLLEAGLGEAEIARLHAPVGLDIGAITPAEIAVSVLAQITQVLRGAGRPGREA